MRCNRGGNFTSIDFISFCSDLGITLSFSSSYQHQSVPAEHSVCTVKNIMKKCHETGTPWCLGLLEYLCTPLDDKTPSSSSLIGHQFKGLCPTFNSLQESQEGTLEHLIERCLHEKLYHDKKSRTLADIPTGSNAAVLDHRSNTWTVGNILDISNRSYTVKLPNGKIIHHNRVDLHLPLSNFIQYQLYLFPFQLSHLMQDLQLSLNHQILTLRLYPNLLRPQAPANHVLILLWDLNQELQGLPVMSKVLL